MPKFHLPLTFTSSEYIPIAVMSNEGRFARRSEVGLDAALAAVFRTHGPGRPGVTVRAYYGALPLMPAARGMHGRGEIPRTTFPEERSSSPKSPIAVADCVDLSAVWRAGRRCAVRMLPQGG